MQSKAEIEKSYEVADPWGYQKSSQDANRKKILVGLAELFCPRPYGVYESGIDIACGEGWITGSLPVGGTLHGIEISDNAAARFPHWVQRVDLPWDRKDLYELVVATGCLYPHYDWQTIVNQILLCARKGTIILISNIQAWENPQAVAQIMAVAPQIFEASFPYNEFSQRVRVFRK